MPFGHPRKRAASLRVVWMLLALVLAAFLGAALGLVWQSYSSFADEPAEEHVTLENPTG